MWRRGGVLPLLLFALAGCPKATAPTAPTDAGPSEEQQQRERLLDRALKGLQCPPGTRKVGDEPPAAHEAWCEKDGGVRHGPYRAWHQGGAKSVAGQYAEGQRDGDWAEWYEHGQRKNEMSYRAGTPDGRFTEWDENGDVTSRGQYENGRLKVPR